MRDPAATRRPAWRRLAPAAALLGAAAAIVLTGGHRLISFDALVAHAGALEAFVGEHGLAAALAYAGVYVAVVALSLPGALLVTLAGGFLFGGVAGGALAAGAASVGATIVFLIARTAIGDGLLRSRRGRIASLAEGFREDAFGYLLFLRLVPAFPFFLVNLAAAALDVPLRVFVAATVIGILPGTFAFAFVGAGLGDLVGEQAALRADCVARGGRDCAVTLDPASLISTPMLLAFLALGAVALLPVSVKRLRRRHASSARDGVR